MDTLLLLRVAGIGILVSIVCQILSRSGREEQSMLVSIAGILLVTLMLIREIATLIDLVRSVFGL